VKIDMQGQVAIVTGAGTGIGRAIAISVAARGAHVLVNDYGGDVNGNPGDERRAEAVAQEIRTAGGIAIADSTAVGPPESGRSITRHALAEFGRVDILINNAGVTWPGSIDGASQDDIERVIAINFWGTFNLIRAVWPVMAEQRFGRIVNVSSNAALGGYTGFASYSASKAGILGLTAAAATEGSESGILVNVIVPVAFTRMAGDDLAAPGSEFAQWLKQYFSPEHIAPVVAYLVSRRTTFSGEAFCVGGGRVSRLVHANNDGYFAADLTPELVAEHIDEIRDVSRTALVLSGTEDTQRYTVVLPYPPKKPT